MQVYGKETIVVKTPDVRVPSDFIRTEYIEFNNDDFEEKISKFFQTFISLADYYRYCADQLENNPLLAIDYLKRAYLITGERFYKERAWDIFQEASIEGRAKSSVEMLLVDFCKNDLISISQHSSS